MCMCTRGQGSFHGETCKSIRYIIIIIITMIVFSVLPIRPWIISYTEPDNIVSLPFTGSDLIAANGLQIVFFSFVLLLLYESSVLLVHDITTRRGDEKYKNRRAANRHVLWYHARVGRWFYLLAVRAKSCKIDFLTTKKTPSPTPTDTR